MGYASKQGDLLALQPDVALLQECSEKHLQASGAPFSHWIGSNPHKGFGILGFGHHSYTLSPLYTSAYPWFLPLHIDDDYLTLLGVWAHIKERQERYVRVTHQAIDYYRPLLSQGRSIVIGDFNSNSIWDASFRGRSHSDLVAKLAHLQLHSVYHAQTHEAQGKETVPTFYLYRHADKGYHLDYAFVSHSLLAHTRLTIPEQDQWLQRSDHIPLILDIASGPPETIPSAT
jgi:hypothetical protein